jgi:predicted lipopolysaccharide heptosyltransferase III
MKQPSNSEYLVIWSFSHLVISRILLVRLREIGDVVFTTPAVRAVRKHYPDAHISYIVEPHAAPIVRDNPHINEVIVAARVRGVRGLAADLRLGRTLRAKRFDLAIDFHGGPRAALLTWLSGARERVGYEVIGRSWMYTRRVQRPRTLRARHSVENQCDLLAAIGIGAPDRIAYPVEMPVDQQAAAEVDERLARAGVGGDERLVVIHVSAGNPFRRWPLAHFIALASTIAREPRTRVVLTSGPSEQDAAARVVDGARAMLGDTLAERIVSCGEFSLAQLRALVERAALYIGGDSGPLHVAATSRVPIVGLYGPTLPARSAPWRDPSIRVVAVEPEPLPCRPCDQRVCAPGDFRCLTSIGAEQVVTAAIKCLT